MAITSTYDPNLNRLTMKATGTLTVAELMEYLNAVLANEEIQEGFVEFVDLTEVKDLLLSFSETSVFEPIWRRYVAKGVKETVVLAPSNVAYGVFRMLITTLTAAMGEEDIPFHVYRDPQAAQNALEAHCV